MQKSEGLVSGSVLFVDMRNFTFLCSKMRGNPSEDKKLKGYLTQYEARFDFVVVQMENFYNEWRNILQRYIEKEKITHAIFQSTGDGIMIALEGKLHYLAAYEIAVEVAKQIRRKLDKDVNPKLVKLGIHRYEDLLDFGIGICSGLFKYVEVPYVVGERNLKDKGRTLLGPPKRTLVTILGTPPNYAARVEEATKAHWNSYIMIAEPTIKLLCKHYNIPLTNVGKIEDVLKVKYLWRHRFKGTKELGLYMYYVKK